MPGPPHLEQRKHYALEARLTILRQPSSPATDPEALALSALGWLLGAPERAERLLALTGLTPEGLRAGLGERAVLAAVLEFLCAHEPDLLAAAQALAIDPSELARAKETLQA